MQVPEVGTSHRVNVFWDGLPLPCSCALRPRCLRFDFLCEWEKLEAGNNWQPVSSCRLEGYAHPIERLKSAETRHAPCKESIQMRWTESRNDEMDICKATHSGRTTSMQRFESREVALIPSPSQLALHFGL